MIYIQKDKLKEKKLKKYPVLDVKYPTKESRRNLMARSVIEKFFSTNYEATSTRKRYMSATLRFVEYLAEHTSLQKIENVKWYHVQEYVEHLIKLDTNRDYLVGEVNGIFYYLNLIKINNPMLQKGGAFLIKQIENKLRKGKR